MATKKKYASGGPMYEANPRTVTPPTQGVAIPPTRPAGPYGPGEGTPRETRRAPPSRTLPNRRGPIEYAKGGSASSRADGCVKKGKTRGKMV